MIPKENNDGDGVGRQPEYGDGGEKDALEDKFEVDSTYDVDWKMFTRGIVGTGHISYFGAVETGLHHEPHFALLLVGVSKTLLRALLLCQW